MSWIKEANKIGKYERSHEGFRIYCTKEPKVKCTVVEREGEMWNRTDFIKGWFVAVDKDGVRFENSSVSELWTKIEWEAMARRYDKRHNKIKQ
jgi:hypothetical protein